MSKQLEQWLTSVGIDIGTSTTKLIVSRLRLGRMSGTFSLPRYEIVERRLQYASQIYPTPLLPGDEIDLAALQDIMAKEYAAAGLSMSDIKSGAVIITGETATKSNARSIVHLLAERAGAFVVATAGAALEAVLAGKGSGAEKRSQGMKGIVANIDIGGGTANTALFHRGKTIGTVSFHIGGQLIRIDKSGYVQYVSPLLQMWLRDNGYRITSGESVDFSTLRAVGYRLVGDMIAFLTGRQLSPGFAHLLVDHDVESLPTIDEMIISGGVAQLMNREAPENLAQTAIYNDFGPLLAVALRELGTSSLIPIVQGEQMERATVIGAGMQSTEVSGSTVFISREELPLRNLPVVSVKLDESETVSELVCQTQFGQAIEKAMRLFDTSVSPPFAIALKGPRYCSYAQLQHISAAMLAAYRHFVPMSRIMVVVSEQDMGKALGQALSIRSDNDPRIVCIDQVYVKNGDYIDLGEPVSGTMIPVIVKSLVFS